MNNELKINMRVLSSDNINMKLDDTKIVDANITGGIKEVDPIFINSPAYTITYEDISIWNHKSNFSGSYNDLTNKPTIPSIAGLATEEYVDNAVANKEFVLNSSTEGSTKKFRVTVDDTGALTAVEVME